jgi:NitT/TauT family transport system substrate-binding protein/putative hydroxymethylpyrimidine transport system substrate-binding protein
MRARATILIAAATLALAGCGGGGSSSPKQLRLALDFTPNAVHAGIYAALAKGLDRKNGVKLVVRAPSASTDSLTLLRTGRADLSIVDIHDLGLAREHGEDLVGVGALVDRPLAAVIASARVKRPRDLEGRRVGVTGLPSDNAVLRAVVQGDGGSYAAVKTVTIGFSAVPDLIAGKVDAATAFWNAEGVTLTQRGVKTHDFRVDRYGAPPYPELVIVATRDALAKERPLIHDALEAIAAGARTALADPDVAVEPLVKASGADAGLVRAELAAVRPVLSPDLLLNRAVLEEWANFDQRFGILKTHLDVSKAFDFPSG